MRSFDHNHNAAFDAKSELKTASGTDVPEVPSSTESSPASVELVPTPDDVTEFFAEFDTIADEIVALDADCNQVEARRNEGLLQNGVRLYAKALALRESTALWTSLIALRFWEERGGWKPKPDDQHTRALHFAFMLGYGAREEDQRKRASKHAKSLEALFDAGASEAEALQFLRDTGGFKGEKRKASASKKAQPVLTFENNTGTVVDPNDLQPNQLVHVVACRSNDGGPTRLIALRVDIDTDYQPDQE